MTAPRKLRHCRPDWIAHCRARQQAQEERRRDDDGMSHGIIPFGAVTMWAAQEHSRQAQALARPVTARVLSADEAGVVLAALCPYCGEEHRHIVISEEWTEAEGWDEERAHPAACGRGEYRLRLGGR